MGPFWKHLKLWCHTFGQYLRLYENQQRSKRIKLRKDFRRLLHKPNDHAASLQFTALGTMITKLSKISAHQDICVKTNLCFELGQHEYIIQQLRFSLRLVAHHRQKPCIIQKIFKSFPQKTWQKDSWIRLSFTTCVWIPRQASNYMEDLFRLKFEDCEVLAKFKLRVF